MRFLPHGHFLRLASREVMDLTSGGSSTSSTSPQVVQTRIRLSPWPDELAALGALSQRHTPHKAGRLQLQHQPVLSRRIALRRGLSAAPVPATGMLTKAELLESRIGIGFTDEELAFRAKWGWTALREASAAANDAAPVSR